MLIDVDAMLDAGHRDLDTLDDSLGYGEVDCWIDERVFTTHLRAYVTAVAHALGIGEESTMIDAAAPASAYLALDGRLPSYPHRELALVWDERHGWAAAVETHSGEDLLLIAYLDPRHGLVPAPHIPAEFITALRHGHPAGRLDPPDLATPSRRHTSELLAAHSRSCDQVHRPSAS